MNQTNFTERCEVCSREVQGEFVVDQQMRGDTPAVRVYKTPDCNYNVCDACNKLVCFDCCCCPETGYCAPCCELYGCSEHRE